MIELKIERKDNMVLWIYRNNSNDNNDNNDNNNNNNDNNDNNRM